MAAGAAMEVLPGLGPARRAACAIHGTATRQIQLMRLDWAAC
jgi:hypothetical protein